jgi:hypothetical protein
MAQWVAVPVLLGLVIVWAARAALINRLRAAHPEVYYSALGAPRLGQLADRTMRPSKWALQKRFLRFIWTGEFLALGDRVVTFTAMTVAVCEFIIVGSFIVAIAVGK